MMQELDKMQEEEDFNMEELLELKMRISVQKSVKKQQKQEEEEEEEMGDPTQYSNLEKITSMLGVKYSKKELFFTPWECRSLKEVHFINFVTKTLQSRTEALDHHMLTFSRIYPKGSRISSSNYHPAFYWGEGAQIVALNYQTKDEPLMINEAFFELNGGKSSGYILKPVYQQGSINFHPLNTPKKQIRNELTQLQRPFPMRIPQAERETEYFTVRIISGIQLPKKGKNMAEVVDPYVKLKLRTSSRNWVKLEKQFKTKMIENNGNDPFWDEQFSF